MQVSAEVTLKGIRRLSSGSSRDVSMSERLFTYGKEQFLSYGEGIENGKKDNYKAIGNLFNAVRTNNWEACFAAITAMPDLVHAVDWGGTAAIHIACFLRHYRIAELLLENGADIYLKDRSGKQANNYIKDADMKAHLEQMFYNKANNINLEFEPLKPQETAFLKFRDEIYMGDDNEVTSLLSCEPYLINYQDRRGNTGLHYACSSDQIQIATLLLHAGANYKIRNKLNEFPISLVRDFHVKQRIGKLAYDLSPEGIIDIENERKRLELECEATETASMNREDAYAARFAVDAAKHMALELRDMRQEEKDTRVFLKKLRLMHVSVRKDVCRNCVQTAFGEALVLVVDFRVTNYLADKEAKRLADIRARRSQKASKVRQLRALLHDNDPLHHVNTDIEDEHITEDDLDEEKILRMIVEKEKKKEFDRLEAERIKAESEEKARREAQARAKREAERVARLEWNQMQADIHKAAKAEFERTKPVRVAKLKRQRQSIAKVGV